MNNLDPMTKVFDVLKARSSDRAQHYLNLEDELMNVFDQQRVRRSRLTQLAIVGTCGLLLTGAVAEAATGVFSAMIKSVTLDTGSGPQPVNEYQATENSDGSATVTLTLPEGKESGTVTVNASGDSQ